MSKHTEITQKLAAMEQGRFQLVCIEYLKYNVGGNIHSPGTVDGKEKTKKGHPDIYLIQDDGKYVLGECTTKENLKTADFNAKLEADLKACLDFEKLKLPQEKIHSIYLCCNTSVETGISEQLQSITNVYNIALKIIGLHELAIYFSGAGKVFAKDFMGIAFQTGQVLTKEEFLKQYHKKNLSTPLDNPIIGREYELSALAEQLNNHDVIIVNGQSGVGKSRLVMEAMELFIESNKEYIPYYIFPKSSEISDDLSTFLKPDASYILLIDDANRQLDNLVKILEKIIESEVTLKVIITVRDYAKDEVITKCGNVETIGFILRKLSNESIKNIISLEPFLITDWDVKNRIVQISDGNPRLAIMAARIMSADPDVNLLSDVTRIYDAYFENILSDNEIFRKKITRQVLGIISFFYSIDTSIAQERKIIKSFGLDVDEFIECAEQLEELEITEIFDGSVVRISEQVIATYFFYDCFFRKPALDFRFLLENCYDKNIYRLKEATLSSINTFGEENIIVKKYPDWMFFWDVIKCNEEIAMSFMKVLGRYFPHLFFTWISSFANPNEINDEVAYTYESLVKPTHNNQNNEILNLLEIFYNAPKEQFQTAVYLSFEYAGSNPETLAILIDKLKTNLYVTKSETSKQLENIKFVHQLLSEKEKSAVKFRKALFLIMDHVILRVSWNSKMLDQIDNKYDFREFLKTFRADLLKAYLDDYEKQMLFVMSLLLNYVWEKRELKCSEIEGDFGTISVIIEKFMDSGRFVECYFVNKYIHIVRQKTNSFEVQLKTFEKKFKSPTYELYKVLSMQYRFSNEGSTWKDFDQQKNEIILKKVIIKSFDDFKNIHNQLVEITNFTDFRSNVLDGVNKLLINILSQNVELGLKCLEYYLQNGNVVFLGGSPIIMSVFSKGRFVSEQFYQIIKKYDFIYQSEWIHTFLLYQPEELIDDQRIEQLTEFYNTSQEPLEIYAEHYNNYEAYRPGTKVRFLNALYQNKKNNKAFDYKLEQNFFLKSEELLRSNFELCQDMYFQQEKRAGSFDRDGKELILFVKRDRLFLERYINWLIKTERNAYINANKVLSGIWEITDAETMVYHSLLKIASVPAFASTEHLSCIFFSSIREEHHKIAFEVLKKIIRDFPDNKDVLNMVIDTCRNSFKQFHMLLIQEIIIQNDDIRLFMKLKFHNNHFSSSGGEIWSEYKSKELKNIKEAILSMRSHYRYFKHKNYLDERIDQEDRHTAHDKKYMFRGFWF